MPEIADQDHQGSSDAREAEPVAGRLQHRRQPPLTRTGAPWLGIGEPAEGRTEADEA